MYDVMHYAMHYGMHHVMHYGMHHGMHYAMHHVLHHAHYVMHHGMHQVSDFGVSDMLDKYSGADTCATPPTTHGPQPLSPHGRSRVRMQS